MTTHNCQNQHKNLPNNLTSAQNAILQILKDNKYSLSETRFIFESMIELIEKTAIIDRLK